MPSLTPKIYSRKFYNPALLLFYRYLARKLPAKWFRPRLSEPKPLKIEHRKPRIEIVSHCWQYAHLLSYQLSSYVINPPKHVDVTVTVFHSPEDQTTVKTLNFFSQQSVNGIHWNWQAIPKEELFSRAIGRNRVAFTTQADWVWYADCDLIFTQGVIDNVVAELQQSNAHLSFPGFEYITDLLPQGDKRLRENQPLEVCNINPDDFKRRNIDRAVGAFQIVRADLLHQVGYCNSIPLFQTPSDHWLKTYEDTVFRWLIETDGVKLQSGGTYRIRHQEKGRYKKGSAITKVRKSLRARETYN